MLRFLWLLYLLCTGATYAAPIHTATITLNDADQVINVIRELETLPAPQKQLSFAQISTPPYSDQFRPNTAHANNFAYHHNAFWLRFNIRSESSADWYLLIDHVVSGRTELFIRARHADAAQTLTQPAPPLFTPLENYRTPAWKLQLPQNQSFSVYLKVYSPKAALILPVRLMQAEPLLTHSNRQSVFFAMILAGLLVLALYNLFLSLILKDVSHFALVLFIVLLTEIFYRYMNLFPSLFTLLIDSDNWYFSSLIPLSQSVIAYYWYTLYRNTDKVIEWFFKGLAIVSLIIAVIISFTSLHNGFIYFGLASLVITVPPLMLRAPIRENPHARYGLLIALIFMASVGIFTPLFTGLFPTYPLYSLHIGYAGGLLAVVLLSLNHADRSRLIRERAERAESGNKATHNFLSTMSHELRTPMHTVLGTNELLKQTPLNQQQQNYLSAQETASHHMLKLIDDILDLTSLKNTKKIVINNQPFNLHHLLSDIKDILSTQMESNKQRLVIKTNHIRYPVLYGDSKRLSQVLLNLIRNAIIHTNTGKVILRVSTGKISTQKSAKNTLTKQQEIHFSVHDTGPGIPHEQQALLFQPFYQADSNTSRKNDGAGLGLAISYGLVKQMGGKLQLNSQPGKGSCFFFSLCLPIQKDGVLPTGKTPPEQLITPPPPVQDTVQDTQPMQEPGEPVQQDKPLTGRQILLVDDGELNRLIGEQLLVMLGACVTLADSGEQALQQLEKQSFGLVFMDVSMPGLDGYQTTQRIRENGWHELPVIALTAHAIEGEKERCLQAGMNDFLSKPFTIEQLTQMVLKHCG